MRVDDYKKMYYTLFNKLTDIIYELQIIQRQTEEMCSNRDMEQPEAQGAAAERGASFPNDSRA